MRVLYITEGFPYPLTSGSLRHYHLIRGLSERHEIHLLSMVGGSFRPEHADGMRPYCVEIETFRSTAESSLWRKAAAVARDLVIGGGTPAAARSLAATAGRLLAGSRFEVIMLNGRSTSVVLEEAAHTPVVVDLCDALLLRLTAQLRYSPPARRALIRWRMRRFGAAERRLISAGSHLLFASARDREDALREVETAPPATILPNGVDLDYWRRSEPRLGGEVVFSGVMNYAPNDDAARLLVRAIMPRVWEARPDIRLRIVGRDPTAALRRATDGDPRVVVTGSVDDVRPHLEHGAVYAAPLRFASGIQNKLLEALAMELPIVTSNVGADGLRGDGIEPPLVVAQGADEFAAAILSGLDRARNDPEPFRSGRTFVHEHFSWPEAVAILERVLTNAVAATGSEPGSGA